MEFFRELLHLLLKPRLNHLFRGGIKKFKVLINTELHGGDDGMFELILNSDLMSVLKLTSAEHFPGEFFKKTYSKNSNGA